MTKKELLWHKLPLKFRCDDKIKQIFQKIIDSKAYEFIAKKVSNHNGDIRVAFDLMKTALATYADEISKNFPEKDEEIRVTVGHLLKIYE
jgi:hypothetical protein